MKLSNRLKEGLTSEYICCSFDNWALQEYCLSLAIFCASRDIWTFFENRRWINHASPGFTERFVWDSSFTSKSKMVFSYIRLMVLNHGIMISKKVASIILKYCGVSLVLLKVSFKISKTSPSSPSFSVILFKFCHSCQNLNFGVLWTAQSKTWDAMLISESS